MDRIQQYHVGFHMAKSEKRRRADDTKNGQFSVHYLSVFIFLNTG
jgi:hypothetical protein